MSVDLCTSASVHHFMLHIEAIFLDEYLALLCLFVELTTYYGILFLDGLNIFLFILVSAI